MMRTFTAAFCVATSFFLLFSPEVSTSNLRYFVAGLFCFVAMLALNEGDNEP